jgi:chromate reductase
MEPIRILGIAGSVRRDSYNRAALRAALALVPEGATLEFFELDDIPIFNQDRERELPDSVLEFKRVIRAADAILFATPEYNYSIAGVLKNAIDWASRPFGDSAWQGKPTGMLGASPGPLGTARAQYHLRQVCVALDMPTVVPEVTICNAAEVLDSHGHIHDVTTRQRIRRLLESLVCLTRLHAERQLLPVA